MHYFLCLKMHLIVVAQYHLLVSHTFIQISVSDCIWTMCIHHVSTNSAGICWSQLYPSCHIRCNSIWYCIDTGRRYPNGSHSFATIPIKFLLVNLLQSKMFTSLGFMLIMSLCLSQRWSNTSTITSSWFWSISKTLEFQTSLQQVCYPLLRLPLLVSRHFLWRIQYHLLKFLPPKSMYHVESSLYIFLQEIIIRTWRQIWTRLVSDILRLMMICLHPAIKICDIVDLPPS